MKMGAAGAGVEVEEGVTRVLLVDDSPVDRRVAQLLLSSDSCAGSFHVIAVDSAKKAMEFLGLNHKDGKEQAIDMVLTDYCMPEMTGYDLLKAVKALNPLKPIPVIVMSSENEPQRISRLRAARAGPGESGTPWQRTARRGVGQRRPSWRKEAVGERRAAARLARGEGAPHCGGRGAAAPYGGGRGAGRPRTGGVCRCGAARANRERLLPFSPSAVPRENIRCLNAGAEDFIVKPLQSKDVQRLRNCSTGRPNNAASPPCEAMAKRKPLVLPPNAAGAALPSARRANFAGVAMVLHSSSVELSQYFPLLLKLVVLVYAVLCVGELLHRWSSGGGCSLALWCA